jgi:DNA-binding SARP family transcriptional activator
VLKRTILVEFLILGPLEATEDGRGLPLGGQKQRAALALLLLHAGEVVSTDRLIDALWGEQPPRTAMTSLQNFISQLRKLLGPQTLVTRAPGYSLLLEPDQLDADRFRRAVAEAREAGPEERARLLGDALALWRGPPLQDFTFDGFAQTEIGRLEEQRLAALEDRLGAELELGRHAELVGELMSLVRDHPLRERFRAHLMLALYRAGRQADALEVYQGGRQALVDELGIEPSPTLKRLHGAILRQEDALEPTAPPPPPSDHYDEIMRAALSGRLVTMLGTGVNIASGGSGGLPGEAEVAAHLAEVFGYPADGGRDLPRVSQFVAVTHGLGPLYDELHSLFDRDYEPAGAHRFLAELARLLRSQGAPAQLIVTTAYHEALECAFAETGEEVDVVSYIAVGRDRGRFLHLRPDGTTAVIDVPNTYAELSLAERTVILKIHGQVDRRPERELESFVVSEDDYIDYLAQTEIASVVPVTLAARLRRSHYLFLGYALREWNLRVFLHRIWRDDVRYRSWAVQPAPNPLELEFWRQQGVRIFDVSLDEYGQRLLARISVPA